MSLPTPEEMQSEFPLSREIRAAVESSRTAITEILSGSDRRLFILAGPCSVHDRAEALDYADHLAALASEVKDRIFLGMRVYVEKSRASLGWRGLARDPDLDESKGAAVGIRESRAVLVGIAEKGLPLGMELVSPLLWPYWMDTLSWACVGSMGVDSQALREVAALIPIPCGFKNSLTGELEGAVNACLAAARPSLSLAPGKDGRVYEFSAPGNPLPHVILRGGNGRPNDRRAAYAAKRMKAAGLVPSILVDASHDNCGKNPRNQRRVVLRNLSRREEGVPLRGILLESYLKTGRQNPAPKPLLASGLSVTDPCLGWAETEELIREIHRLLAGG